MIAGTVLSGNEDQVRAGLQGLFDLGYLVVHEGVHNHFYSRISAEERRGREFIEEHQHERRR